MKFLINFLVIVCMLSISNLSAQNSEGFEELMTTLKDKNSTLIVYTVQVGAFITTPRANHFNGVNELFSGSYDDGFTRFFSGLFNSVEEAVQYRDKLRNRGFKDSFVLGLDGGFDRILIELD